MLALFVLTTPARAAVTLSCRMMIMYSTWDFTMVVDPDAQTIRIKPEYFDQLSGRFFGGDYRGDSRENHADFRDRYIDIWFFQRPDDPTWAKDHPWQANQSSYGMRLDRQTLKLLPIGSHGDPGRRVAEGSGCQIRVL